MPADLQTRLRDLCDLDMIEAACVAGNGGAWVTALDEAASQLGSEGIDVSGVGVAVTGSTLTLLAQALRQDLNFLTRHPHAVFASLWNRCYWHDGPEQSARLPGEAPVSGLVEVWRVSREADPSFCWLRSLIPLPGEGLDGEPNTDSEINFDQPRVSKWSLDASMVLFADEAGLRIYTADGIPVMATDSTGISDAAWSPDGTQIAVGGEELHPRLLDAAHPDGGRTAPAERAGGPADHPPTSPPRPARAGRGPRRAHRRGGPADPLPRGLDHRHDRLRRADRPAGRSGPPDRPVTDGPGGRNPRCGRLQPARRPPRPRRGPRGPGAAAELTPQGTQNGK